jgi:hypothetical protein
MKRKGGNRGQRGGNPPPREELLTVQQVAEKWQVSQRMVRRMIADDHTARPGSSDPDKCGQHRTRPPMHDNLLKSPRERIK